MPFNKKIKKEVNEKAAFRCCRCQKIGIDVHHIVPEGRKGPNTIANAAPLCPNCHDWFGGNPEKRKMIKDMRNWWYKQVEKQYPAGSLTYKQLEHINTLVAEASIRNEASLEELKERLNFISDKIVASISSTTASTIATQIITTSSSSSSSRSSSSSSSS